MTDPRVQEIAEQVRLDLLDQLRDLQQNGRRYIEEYVDAYMGPKTTWRPRPSFHPKLAELIRELTAEAALATRTCGTTRITDLRPSESVVLSHGSSRREAA